MFCKNCGKEYRDGQKFCTNCGAVSSDVGRQEINENIATKENTWSKVVRVLVAVAIIGWIIYANLDEGAITTNNEGISSFDSGNNEQAAQQFKEAADSAVTDETKINTLKNLAYVYSTDGQDDLALKSFKDALTLATTGSFDYYLISGEIAFLEGKPNAAKLSYSKAYEISPDNYQINNALNLFYLDLEEIAPQYANYPKALTHAQKAYDLSGPDVKNIATQNLGMAYYFNENYNQAIALLSPYTNSEPYAAYLVGLAYLNKEDDINAKLYLRQALNAGVEMPQEILDYLNS